MYDFKFADIGDGIEEGKILEWKFKEGDKVKEGDTLVIVETDKVNAELPSPVDGVITKIGKQEGEMILVGETVVIIDDGTGGEVPAAASTPASTAAKAAAPASNGPKATYDFKFADIGDGIEEGKILEWKFKEGDKVNEGDTLVIVETDKVNAELPSPVTGTIVKRGKEEGEMILVGETVVLLDDGSGNYIDGGAVAAPAEEEEKAASVIGELSVSSDVIASSNEGTTQAPAQPTRKKALATPVARNLAKQLGVNIHEVPGTGANGRVMKDDIRKFAEAKSAPKAQAATSQATTSTEGRVRVEQISTTRRAISRAMTDSKSIIPETVLMDDVVIDDLVEMRKRVKPLAAAKGINVTYMAFISRAVIIALKEFEIFNSSFNHETNEITFKNYINLGFAVDTPTGLMVPNIKDADQLSVFDLASDIRTLADKAIDRKLQLDEMRDGTFTITNFGSAGISYGTPVINYPEVAILGVGKISKKPVVIDDEIKIAHVLPLSIAVDHRIIDGADAGRFLMRVKELLANPELMLLS
mgnify:CR=1 FL=1